MHSLRQLFFLCSELFLAPPECRNFHIMEMGAELLQVIHFPLDSGNVALNSKLLQFPGTAERRARREPFRRDARDEVRLHWI